MGKMLKRKPKSDQTLLTQTSYHFEAMWNLHPRSRCKDTMANAIFFWQVYDGLCMVALKIKGVEAFKLVCKLKSRSNGFLSWDRIVFGNLQ